MSAFRHHPYQLGIIGGLGPLASAELYARITRHTVAKRDQDHIATVVLSIPQTPDRTEAIFGRGSSPFADLVDAVTILNDLDVELIVMACNTAHHWYETLSAISRAPILHVADAAIAALEVRQDGIKQRVMILGTRGTLASGFYQKRLKRSGHDPLLPDEFLQHGIDAVVASVKAGKPRDAADGMTALLPYLAMQRIEVVLLACTELSIAWHEAKATETLPIDAIDVTDALVLETLRRLGRNISCGDEAPSTNSVVYLAVDAHRSARTFDNAESVRGPNERASK